MLFFFLSFYSLFKQQFRDVNKTEGCHGEADALAVKGSHLFDYRNSHKPPAEFNVSIVSGLDEEKPEWELQWDCSREQAQRVVGLTAPGVVCDV